MLYMCVMNIMNVLRTGMNMYISHIRIMGMLQFDCSYVFAPFSVCRIFFRCFGMSCFVCIVWSYLCIFLVFVLSTVPSDLSFRILSFALIVLLCSFRPNIFPRFSSVSIFTCCWSFLICVSSLISHPCFEFLFVFFKGTTIFSQTNFTPA